MNFDNIFSSFVDAYNSLDNKNKKDKTLEQVAKDIYDNQLSFSDYKFIDFTSYADLSKDDQYKVLYILIDYYRVKFDEYFYYSTFEEPKGYMRSEKYTLKQWGYMK